MENNTDRYLEIGPGPQAISGFESVNIVDDGFSHVANAMNELSFSDDTFSIVYASHMLEHVPWTHTILALK